MEIFHVIDVISGEVINMYFVDVITGERADYSIEEFMESIRQ